MPLGALRVTNQAFYGSLDELRLLNWALTPEDIAARIEFASGVEHGSARPPRDR